jgi:hypothetical protein
MKTNKKTGKLCEECSGSNIKTHLMTFPIKIGEKQVNVGRVSVKECMDCHALKPTKTGQNKIDRCMMTMAFMTLFDDD